MAQVNAQCVFGISSQREMCFINVFPYVSLPPLVAADLLAMNFTQQYMSSTCVLEGACF